MNGSQTEEEEEEEERGLCDHRDANYRQTLHNINLVGLNCTDAGSSYHEEDLKKKNHSYLHLCMSNLGFW